MLMTQMWRIRNVSLDFANVVVDETRKFTLLHFVPKIPSVNGHNVRKVFTSINGSHLISISQNQNDLHSLVLSSLLPSYCLRATPNLVVTE